MSSFYGPGGAGRGGSGGSGTTDYNELTNKPIKNIRGVSQELFYNLRGLDFGNYSLTGYFKTNAADDLRNTEAQLSVNVFKDSSTGEKVIQYMEVKDGQTYLHVIIYRENSDVEQTVYPLTSTHNNYCVWEDFQEEF